MDEEKQNIRKNKAIITVAVIILVAIMVIYVLLNSNLNDDFYFHYVCNGKTGEPLGFFISVFMYVLFWFFIAGSLPAVCVFLLTMCLYFFLHRKDENILSKTYCPEYEEEFYYGGFISLTITYGAVLVLMVLHITNIITIDIF